MTMEVGYPVAEAIAIRGDRILAVGNDEEMLGLTGPETQLIDLDGQTLLPGFADGHTHILAFPGRRGASLDEAQDVALRQGFTSVTEMWADDGFVQELLDAESAGRLRLRVNVFPTYNAGTLDDYGNTVIVRNWHPENDPILDSDRMLRIPGIKFFVDGAGVPGRGCPAMSQPYPPSTTSQAWFQQICGSEYGDLYWSQEELNQVVAEVQAEGFRAAFHAMGDQAIETALNAIEFSTNGQSNTQYRHQIQHSSLLRPDQLDRYVSMGILASVRGYFNTCDQDDYSSEWAANRYALPGSGVHAYLETDFGWTADPDDPLALRISNPMIHLYGLVTHRQLYADGVCLPAPWLARHEIPVEQALLMMTYEPAFAVSQEDVLGTLEPGKYADLIILSENPLTIDPNALKDLEVWMTMVAGQVEYNPPPSRRRVRLSQ
jgi:predicted amidohydrolase YtcJ